MDLVQNFASLLTTAFDSFRNMNYFTQIDVLHLWEFNAQHRGDTFSYIIEPLERMTATSFEVE